MYIQYIIVKPLISPALIWSNLTETMQWLYIYNYVCLYYYRLKLMMENWLMFLLTILQGHREHLKSKLIMFLKAIS